MSPENHMYYIMLENSVKLNGSRTESWLRITFLKSISSTLLLCLRVGKWKNTQDNVSLISSLHKTSEEPEMQGRFSGIWKRNSFLVLFLFFWIESYIYRRYGCCFKSLQPLMKQHHFTIKHNVSYMTLFHEKIWKLNSKFK